jgi:hypothetical protein
LDGFETQTSQTSSHFFPIPSNPCVLGITEQALTLYVYAQVRLFGPKTYYFRIQYLLLIYMLCAATLIIIRVIYLRFVYCGIT